MSQKLLAQMRKNREVKVTVGKFTFMGRRPTDVEAVDMHRAGAQFNVIAADYVTGWDGVVEDDLVGGGGQDAVAFAADLWREWCADHPEFWTPIAEAVLAAYTKHREDMEKAPNA